MNANQLITYIAELERRIRQIDIDAIREHLRDEAAEKEMETTYVSA